MLLSLLPKGLAWLGGGSNVPRWAAPLGIGDSWWDLFASFGLPPADNNIHILLCPLHLSDLDKTVAFNLTCPSRPVFSLMGIWRFLEHVSLELQLEAILLLCYHSVFSCVFTLFGKASGQAFKWGSCLQIWISSFGFGQGTHMAFLSHRTEGMVWKNIGFSFPYAAGQADFHYFSVVFLHFVVHVCKKLMFIVKPHFWISLY